MNIIDKLKAKLLSVQPENVAGTDNLAYNVYYEYLMRLLKGRFVIKCPEEWNQDYMLDHLIEDECLLIVGTRDYGVIPLSTGVSGNNIWNRPSQFVTANHIIGEIRGTIGVDGAAVYLNGDKYCNGRAFINLISNYAYKLAAIDCSIDVNLLNSRAAMIFDCADSKQQAEAKAIYEKISRGEPAVFVSLSAATSYKGDGRLNFHTLNVGQTYIVDKLQDAKRTCLNEFLNIIGVKTANTDKKERLITSEVESNNSEISYGISYINNSLEKGCNVARRLYGINLSIRMKDDSEMYSQGMAGEQNDNSGND